MKNTDGLDKWKVFSDYICCVHPYDMSQLSTQSLLFKADWQI